ncbi:hypothetical protein DPSP01_004103 [Paraphaeosphaeria sporulosa]
MSVYKVTSNHAADKSYVNQFAFSATTFSDFNDLRKQRHAHRFWRKGINDVLAQPTRRGVHCLVFCEAKDEMQALELLMGLWAQHVRYMRCKGRDDVHIAGPSTGLMARIRQGPAPGIAKTSTFGAIRTPASSSVL